MLGFGAHHQAVQGCAILLIPSSLPELSLQPGQLGSDGCVKLP